MINLSLVTLCILLLPLAGFMVVGLCKLPKLLSGIIANTTIFLSFILTVFLFFKFSPFFGSVVIKYFNWITVGKLVVNFSLQIDTLSLLMMMIVTGVGFLIHLYSIGYMWHDEGFSRFFSYMNLFIFFMLLLVMASNYLLMFAGWEGVGLCSYLLIGFWFKNTEFNNAARKAFIMNRIGDLGFLLGLFLIAYNFGSFDYLFINNLASQFNPGNSIITLITLLLFIGAIGKSAQIPLFTWLPDAMAGPTPVSALIHAATMVTAGIYMVVRSNVLYTLAPFTLEVITIIGIATAFVAGTIALYQNDIKKILAYSTVSQLGLMFTALGTGCYTGAMFHLTTHAFFKALLFLAAGSVIHALQGEQDIRNMGGLRKKLPITFFVFLIAALAISGIPPFAGFFSKDEILIYSFQANPILWFTASAVSIMTALYMFRLLFLAFGRDFRGKADHAHESPLIMTIPLLILAILSIVGGFIGVPASLGGTLKLHSWLSSVINWQIINKVPEHAEQMLMIFASSFALIAIILSWWWFISNKQVPSNDEKMLSKPVVFLKAKWYFDELYQFLFVKPLGVLSQWLYNTAEIKGIDAIVNRIGTLTTRTGSTLRYMQAGTIGVYLLIMVIAIVAMLFGIYLL